MLFLPFFLYDGFPKSLSSNQLASFFYHYGNRIFYMTDVSIDFLVIDENNDQHDQPLMTGDLQDIRGSGLPG